MSASKSSYEPRHEAEVVAWEHLTEDQRAAVEGAHGLFSQMAKLADEAKKQETSGLAELDIFLPHIDEKRRNHVVLIDGERGTGKTAVMLRLLVDWSAAVRGQLREDIESKEHGKSPVTLDSAIVPVGLLDLQALSPKAMLGLHLAGHLQRVVEAMERRTPKTTKSVPWAPGESEELKSRKAWQKFLRAAAAAWDGNLKERQGKIDPEAYVIELEHAERERLEIGATFRAFVDALVEEYHERIAPAKKKPFFVITIDDADLNPQRTMEIFELIRVLWHPRVGFLIAGDGALFKSVLEEDFKQHKIAPAHAEALARDSYRKAIPPRQRFPTGLNPADRFKKITDALSEVPTRSSVYSSTLDMRDYFLQDEELKDALPTRIRDLLDLAGDIRREKPSPIRLAWKLWQEAWDRADMPGDVRNEGLIQSKDSVGDASLIFSHELKWTLEPIELIQFEVRDNVDATVHLSARFALASDKLELPTSLIASYRLALEVASLDGPYLDETPVKTALNFSPELVRIDFLNRGKIVGSASWFMPAWGSFRTYLLFFQTWRRVAKNTGFVALDILAKRYIELCLNLAKGTVAQNGDTVEIAVAPEVPTWSALAARIVEIMRTDTHAAYDQAAVESWASIQAFMLAAPEYGLSASSANEWLNALRNAFRGNWKLHALMLRGYRSGNNRINASEFDKHFSEYQWASIVTDVANGVNGNATQTLLDPLLNHLRFIPVRHSRDGAGGPTSLAGYITSVRKQMLAQMNPDQLQRMNIALSDMPTGIHGAEQIVLHKLWETIGQHEPTRNFLVWDPTTSGLRVSLSFGGYETSANTESAKISMALDNGLVLCKMVLDWDQSTKEHFGISDDFFVRMAWDIVADANDDKVPRSNMKKMCKTWDGAIFWHRASRRFKWPVPDWPALFDWELLIDRWNDLLADAQKLLVPGDNITTQRVVDAVAFWFIASIHQMPISRTATMPFAFRMNMDEWTSLGKCLLHTGTMNGVDLGNVPRNVSDSEDRIGARWNAYEDWWHRVVVMAAPESGLSAEAANAFLEGLFTKHQLKKRPMRTREDAIKIRRKHAVDCGIDSSDVDPRLANIDSEHPEHPWHKFFAEENQ